MVLFRLFEGKRDEHGNAVLEGGDGWAISFRFIQIIKTDCCVVVGKRLPIFVPSASPMFQCKEETLFEWHRILDVPTVAGV